MREYQIDCEKFCGYIKVENNIIIDAMPIVKIFIGQPVENLTKWVTKKFKYCTIRRIK